MNFFANPKRFASAAALLAPIVIVQGLRSTMGSAADPASSHAAGISTLSDQPTPAIQETSPALKPLSAAQREAQKWLHALDRRVPVQSPLAHAPAPADAPVIRTSEPITEPAQQPVASTKPRADLSLGGIMGAKDRTLALIGGKVYRAGDTIEPGWTISQIDPRAQTVTITGPANETITLRNSWQPKQPD
ncbi:MAG: hypothetical protein IBJ18_02915 [Phycisphaerales bacterium]|nr:hypothetical protein [Phycisphaerales bacterium]